MDKILPPRPTTTTIYLPHERDDHFLSTCYEDLEQCFQTLEAGIAADPLGIAERLLEEGLASPAHVKAAQLQGVDDYKKAGALVQHIRETVEHSPENFNTILDILNEFPWLQDSVKAIREEHGTNQAMEIMVSSQRSLCR